MKKSGINSNRNYQTRISGSRERPSESPKVNTHHEPQSSEDSVSDYENELNKKMHPRRVSGRDTRNKLRSAKKIDSSSEVGKSAKEHQGKVVGKELQKSAGPITRSNMHRAKISAIKDEVNNTQTIKSAGFATKSKGKSLKKSEDRTSDCASELSQVATKSLKKSEDGTSDCASELKLQPQFHVASKQARGFAGRVTRNRPKNTRSRSKVSEINEEEGIDVHLLRQTIAENVDRYLFDLHELLDAEGLLKPGLFDKVDTLAELFLDDLYGEIEKIV